MNQSFDKNVNISKKITVKRNISLDTNYIELQLIQNLGQY